LPSLSLFSHSMSSCRSCSGTVAENTRECEYCPLRFCLLRNTPYSGKIGGTRPLALLLFSSEQNLMDARFFQALLTFSPVSGVLPDFALGEKKTIARFRDKYFK